MRTNRARLLREIGRLENRLSQEWSQDAPPVPDQLAPYQAAWHATLARQAQCRDENAFHAAVMQSDPLIVGDFHPLRRARRQFARLLRDLPDLERPSLLLELLPDDIVMTADAALRRPSLSLIDGRSCATTYSSLLREVARRGGLVAGAWTEGDAPERDLHAARVWQRLCQSHPDFRWMLFFGDWHLADEHLPSALRAVGASPVMLHQSPEPLWGTARKPQQEQHLELGDGHWAWMHTPPLSHWASALQDGLHDAPEAAAEVTEHLVEALALNLAATLNLPEPHDRPLVWPQTEWREFHETLPAVERRAIACDTPPQVTVTHPNRPSFWFPELPDLNAVVDAAGHVVANDYPLGKGVRLGARIRERAFRRAWACILNPFLGTNSFAASAGALYPGVSDAEWHREIDRLARAIDSGRHSMLSARQQVLAIEVLGVHAGHRLAADERLDLDFVEQFLADAGAALEWRDIAASLRAA